MHYNFCRVHKTLRVTPAMEAGLTNHVWTTEEMLETIGFESVPAGGLHAQRRCLNDGSNHIGKCL